MWKKKLKDIGAEEVEERGLLGYRLFDLRMLNTVFSKMICTECKTQSSCLQEALKQGLVFKYTITCHDVVYSVRRLGKGCDSLTNFLYLMNHRL